MRGSILLCICIILAIPTSAQPSRQAVDSEVARMYRHQLNVIHLPDSFYSCAYRVVLHNYNGKQPSKDVGDECFSNLLSSNLKGVEYSDGGRLLFQAMVPAFISTCSTGSNGSDASCSCYYNRLDQRGLNMEQVLNIESTYPEFYQNVYTSCFGRDPNLPNEEEKDDLKDRLAELFREEFNITYIPNAFYSCVEEHSGNSLENNFDAGYKASKECMPNYVHEFMYSDRGVKMLNQFNDAFTVGCKEANNQYSTVLKVASFCSCLHSQYVKYEVGFEEISSDEFFDTILSQKITEYCVTTNQKSN